MKGFVSHAHSVFTPYLLARSLAPVAFPVCLCLFFSNSAVVVFCKEKIGNFVASAVEQMGYRIDSSRAYTRLAWYHVGEDKNLLLERGSL